MNDVNIYYEEFGKGETVLFLHSHFSRGLLAFSGQILPFSKHYRCIYPDFRGHGCTTAENLLRKNDTNFIEDMRLRHLDAHRGDWQTYVRMTVADWKNHPSLSDDEWQNIRCPALFINGENDSLETCTELHEKVPASRIYEARGGGHRPHFVGEQVEEVNAKVLEFLSDIDR